MAIGLGCVFGFHFPENFNYPYIAASVKDFWRRWHISLSSWFRDYLYIPLGGNRGSKGKHIRNLLIVWGLTGFWHGAAWTFLLWGLYYAVLLIGEQYLWGDLLKRLPKVVQHGYALFLILLGWLIFRSTDLHQIQTFLSIPFGAAGQGAGTTKQLTIYWSSVGSFSLAYLRFTAQKNMSSVWPKRIPTQKQAHSCSLGENLLWH